MTRLDLVESEAVEASVAPRLEAGQSVAETPQSLSVVARFRKFLGLTVEGKELVTPKCVGYGDVDAERMRKEELRKAKARDSFF